ncbi:MAG: hypothetical protein HY301_20465 [Verrucomicrobia bacterium]|nr:hypothetical protein [Verrucomicrobiota bacterium]
MPASANVTSVDALETFRSNLLIYLSKARPALEEVSDAVIRTRVWLQSDQRVFLENQMRRRKRDLDEAQQELFRASISRLGDATVMQQMAVQRAKLAMREAEEKMHVLKRWNRDFDSRVEPLLKEFEKLHSVLSQDMPKAVAFLTHAVNTLDAYAKVAPPSADTAPAPAAPTEGAGATEPAKVSEGGRT